MIDRELFELIVGLVCTEHNVKWQECLYGYIKQTNKAGRKARKIIFHLAYIFIGNEFVTEVLNIHPFKLYHYSNWCRENPTECEPIQQLINLYLKTRDKVENDYPSITLKDLKAA